jgi:hypothetical protein
MMLYLVPEVPISRPGITIPRAALLVIVAFGLVLWAGIIGGLLLAARLLGIAAV